MFGTSGIRGPIGERVTAELGVSLGHALAATGHERVVVGRDARTTGRPLADALTAGAREAGIEVVRLGVAATPTIARAVGPLEADCGVAVTASHNPPTDNGFKLWSPDGSAFDGDERAAVAAAMDDGVREHVEWTAFGAARRLPEFDESPGVAARGGRAGSTTGGVSIPIDAGPGVGDGRRETGVENGSSATDANRLSGPTRPTARHVERLVAAIGQETDVSVVVDTGNGAGGVTAAALDRLGCAVHELDARPDGRFPGRASEPTPEHCDTLTATVGGTDADFGVAHDGDADRAQFVDETGTFVGGDTILALFAAAACESGERAAMPVDASLAVEETLADRGVDVVRTQVGDTYVAEACHRDGVTFGGEASGAWIWPGETYAPDGPLAACRMAALVAERGPLSALAETVVSYPIRRDSIEVGGVEKSVVMERVRSQVDAGYSADRVTTLDGVRVETDDGWFLIRPSGTQPLVRVTAEARSAGDADRLASEAREIVVESVEGD